MTNITLGSDPELHIFDQQKRRIVSAIPVVQKDKNSPIHLGDGIHTYADNVLIEATFPPATEKKEFIGRFKNAFSKMQNFLGDRYRLVPKAAHTYHKDELKDNRAWEIGCSPNFDAYSVSINESTPFKTGLRTGSCHIHVGNEKLQDFDTRISTIKLLDVFLGCASVLFDRDKTSKARRQYYGTASEHRPTSFGLEYRVLSPFVLNSPETIDLTVDLVNHTLTHVFKNTINDVLQLVKPEDVRAAINTCNRKLAAQILNKAELPTDLKKRATQKYNFDFYKNWNI